MENLNGEIKVFKPNPDNFPGYWVNRTNHTLINKLILLYNNILAIEKYKKYFILKNIYRKSKY